MKKKLTAIFVSFMVFCSCLASWIPQTANAVFLQDYIEAYEQEAADPSATYAVIITFDDKGLSEYEAARRLGTGTFVQTAEGQNLYRSLTARQNALLEEIEALLETDLAIAYRYTAVLNGFCIYITLDQCRKLLEEAPSLDYDGLYLGAPCEASEMKTPNSAAASPVSSDLRKDAAADILEYVGNDGTYGDGTGMVVAVIDTELDTGHEYFTMKEPGTGRLTKEYVDRISQYLSIADSREASYYISEKLPYAVNYETFTTDTYHNDPNIIHGSHVSGIAVGNGAGVSQGHYQINGNAPNAQLVFMGNSALRMESLLASMDDCLYLEADVVNCSYGSEGTILYGTGNQKELESAAIEKLEKAGIQVCVAAGNSDKYQLGGAGLLSHPAYSIPGQPNALPCALSIASADNLFSVTPCVTASDGAVYQVKLHQGYDAFDLDGQTIEYVAIPGIGSAADFDGIDVSGKYALVRRGEIPFADKSQNAADAGAVGIIFYDNVAGEALLVAGNSVLPGFFVSMEDGMALAALEDATLRFSVSVSYKEGDPKPSSFTNWGCTNLLTVKPDLLCFGGGIYSSVPDGRYQFFDGTSMASPQAAGLYAVMKQNLASQKEKYGIEGNSDYPGIISNLLMSTAHAVSDDKSGVVISPRRQGNGVPNLKNALETPAYLYTDSEPDHYRPKVSLGDDRERTGKYSFCFSVKNISDAPVTYGLSYDLISDAVSGDDTEDRSDDALADFARTLSGQVVFRNAAGAEITDITVAAGEAAKIEVSVSLSEDDMEYMDRYFENGTYAEGYIHLKDGQNPDLLLSFMGFYGSWLDSPVFDAFLYDGTEAYFDPSYLYSDGGLILGVNFMDLFLASENPAYTVPCFSPDGDGVFDSFSVSTTFLRPVYDLTFKIYNQRGAVVYEQYAGDQGSWDPSFNMSPSKIMIDWDGRDTDGRIHNGEIYRIEYTCRVLKEDDAWIHTSLPVVVDTEKPELLTLFYGTACDGTDMVSVNAADNREIQGAMLIGPDGEPYSVASGVSYQAGKWCIALKLPEDPTGYIVEIYDYAGNCTAVPAADAVRFLDGDVTGDGEIDGRDATVLLQHLADWDVFMNAAAADVDADGAVTGADATRLLQYLAEWDVALGAA